MGVIIIGNGEYRDPTQAPGYKAKAVEAPAPVVEEAPAAPAEAEVAVEAPAPVVKKK